MVRRKYEVVGHITDVTKRRVVMCKRRQGLLKKAMELAKLCAVDVSLVIVDHEINRYHEYRSSKDFDLPTC